ncbi:MAG TPA: HepT-like ribonuclease domain-containing protein, partial [Pyrinomonadaceae bacterium]
TIDAVARNLEIIGEAVRQLPNHFKTTHPDIPWSQIAGMRNRIVHEYFRLDLEIIWQIVHADLPDLGASIALLT